SPPGLGENAYYDAVNERLGATLDFQVSDGNAYADKVQTVLASPKDVADWMVIPSWNIPTRFIEGVGNVFQDLTDHLAGDAIHDYPNLADRKSTRLNSSHVSISYAVFCLKK